MSARVITWDWREQPDLILLADAVKELSDGKLHVYEVNTRSDEYAIVISQEVLTKDQVEAEWSDRWDGDK